MFYSVRAMCNVGLTPQLEKIVKIINFVFLYPKQPAEQFLTILPDSPAGLLITLDINIC